MKKLVWTVLKILALLWAVLFAVFYFDLDGKFMYYIWEPLMIKRFDNMERPDMTKTPYGPKEPIRPEE